MTGNAEMTDDIERIATLEVRQVEIREDVREIKKDVAEIKDQLSQHRGFLRGIAFVFAAVGSGLGAMIAGFYHKITGGQ